MIKLLTFAEKTYAHESAGFYKGLILWIVIRYSETVNLYIGHPLNLVRKVFMSRSVRV